MAAVIWLVYYSLSLDKLGIGILDFDKSKSGLI